MVRSHKTPTLIPVASVLFVKREFWGLPWWTLDFALNALFSQGMPRACLEHVGLDCFTLADRPQMACSFRGAVSYCPVRPDKWEAAPLSGGCTRATLI